MILPETISGIISDFQRKSSKTSPPPVRTSPRCRTSAETRNCSRRTDAVSQNACVPRRNKSNPNSSSTYRETFLRCSKDPAEGRDLVGELEGLFGVLRCRCRSPSRGLRCRRDGRRSPVASPLAGRLVR